MRFLLLHSKLNTYRAQVIFVLRTSPRPTSVLGSGPGQWAWALKLTGFIVTHVSSKSALCIVTNCVKVKNLPHFVVSHHVDIGGWRYGLHTSTCIRRGFFFTIAQFDRAIMCVRVRAAAIGQNVNMQSTSFRAPDICVCDSRIFRFHCHPAQNCWQWVDARSFLNWTTGSHWALVDQSPHQVHKAPEIIIVCRQLIRRYEWIDYHFLLLFYYYAACSCNRRYPHQCTA